MISRLRSNSLVLLLCLGEILLAQSEQWDYEVDPKQDCPFNDLEDIEFNRWSTTEERVIIECKIQTGTMRQ